MKKIITFLLLLFCNTVFCQLTEKNEKYIKIYNDSIIDKTFVIDYEKLFTKNELNELKSIISGIEKETSIEIAIITFDEEYKTDEEFHENALFLANYFSLGKKELNNGIFIGISKKSRKMRIENGDGIVPIFSNVETKLIVDNSFIKKFKEGKYFEGTLDGIKKIIELLRLKIKK